jgi:A/G-specific adenine glycosylase
MSGADQLASTFAPRLLAWQRQHGRHDLPWSGTRDPYRVWLSEVMLQQTQVSTVRAYFARFTQAFPTVQALAAAPLDEVLALWAGLGYYSRARNLHACAQAVAALGGFPQSAAALQTLPGIGPSTARAVAAFCFGERLSILDGNVKRVLSRLLAFEGDMSQARAVQQLWDLADTLVPTIGDDMPAYTQGLMDLGASLCASRNPQCAACPVQDLCAAQAQGRATAFPIKTRKLKRSRREHWWLWLQRPADGAVWLQQRPATGVWGGLWSLPLFDDEAALRAALGPGAEAPALLPQIQHALTHFDWLLHPRRADWQSPEEPFGEGRWVAPADWPAHGMPAPLRKLLLG